MKLGRVGVAQQDVLFFPVSSHTVRNIFQHLFRSVLWPEGFKTIAVFMSLSIAFISLAYQEDGSYVTADYKIQLNT